MTQYLDTASTRYRLLRRYGQICGEPLLTRLARAGRPRLAARLMAHHCVRIKPAGPGGASLLFLPKPGFSEDIRASAGRDARLGLVAMDRGLLKAVAAAFLPPAIDDNYYRNARAEHGARMDAYRAFLAELWPVLRRRLGVRGVLTGNFSYFAEQELCAVVDTAGDAFIAMHKECLKTPGLEPFFEYTYRDRKLPFAGRLITVYNEIERGIQVAAGVAPAERIHVTGMPRLDEVHHWREGRNGAGERQPGPPRVLFMSFNDQTGAPKIQHKDERGWEDLPPEFDNVAFPTLVRECHAAMVDLARLHPEIEVRIKTKNHAVALATIEEAFGTKADLPANLHFILGGDPFAPLTAADVVCAFNSTSMFEALAAGKTVVQPHFAEAADPRLKTFIVDLGAGARTADSRAALVDLLAATARERAAAGTGDGLAPEAMASLQHWTGNPDGRAGRRTADLIAESLGLAPSAHA